MKHSNFALAILSAIILSACGSSSSNDNQSVDPTPTPNQNSNTTTPTPTPTPAKPISPAANPNPESIPQQSSSSNANNNQPISSQASPIVKAKPNPKTAGGSKQKNKNQGAGNGNGATAGNGPIKAPDLTGLAAKSEAELKKLLADAVQAATEAGVKKDAANTKVGNLEGSGTESISHAINGLSGKAMAVNAKSAALETSTDKDTVKKELLKALAEFELQKEEVQKRIDALAKAKAEEAEQKALEEVAKKEQATYKNALETQKAVKEDPAVVVEAKQAEEKVLQLQAKEEAAKGNKELLQAELAVIDEQIKALKAQNSANIKVTTHPKTPADVKEKLEADTKANNDKIAELEKQKKEKDEAVVAADKKEKDIADERKTANNDAKDKKDAAAHRGVYGDSKYDKDSAPFQDISKVDHTGTQWILTLKGGDTLTLDTGNITDQIGSMASKKWGTFGKVDGKDVIVNDKVLPNDMLFGSIDGKFFSVGQVAEKEKVAALTDTVTFGSNSPESGKAILKTPGGVNLVADVTAQIAVQGKKLTGNFNNFRINTGVASQGTPSYNNPKLTPSGVNFTASIKENKFTPIEMPDEAKVYGYFYGDGNNVTGLGGLVEHDEFNGAFGAKK